MQIHSLIIIFIYHLVLVKESFSKDRPGVVALKLSIYTVLWIMWIVPITPIIRMLSVFTTRALRFKPRYVCIYGNSSIFYFTNWWVITTRFSNSTWNSLQFIYFRWISPFWVKLYIIILFTMLLVPSLVISFELPQSFIFFICWRIFCLDETCRHWWKPILCLFALFILFIILNIFLRRPKDIKNWPEPVNVSHRSVNKCKSTIPFNWNPLGITSISKQKKNERRID